MIEPTGYTALDLVGYTDKGTYAANVNYVKNDLVHYGGNIWRILIDDTIGITPAEGPNYTLFIGEPTNLVERIIAPLEDNPATVAYQTGRQIIYNDYLYEVIQNIAVGDILIAYEDDPTNANIKLASPVETQVLALTNKISAVQGYFSNKKICFYGDSLIMIPTNYVQYINDIDDSIQITNRGVGGTTIGDAISRLTNATDLNTYDIIVLAYGTNSWTTDQTISGMLGQYQQCFNIINSKAPYTKIVCVTPFYSYWPSKMPTNGAKNTFHDYVKAIIEYCTSNGIPVIDFYSQSGVNRLNYSTWLLDSGGQYAGVYVHENEALAHKLAQIFIEAKFVSYEASTHTVFTINNHNVIVATRCNGDIFLELIGSPLLTDINNFTLPESYRPSYMFRTICMVTGGHVALLTFNTDGTISCSYTSSDASDQISASPVHYYNRNYYSI